MSKAPQWPPAGSEPAVVHPDAPGPDTKLQVHYDECFGCGNLETGLHLQSTMGARSRVFSQFTVTEAHQGAPGLAHGGLLACAFDEALGATVGNLLQRPAVTGKLETDFLRPVPVGSTLFIVATVDGVAGRKIYASADGHLDSEDGPVALRARSIYIEVPVEHFTTHGHPNALEKFRQTKDGWDINP
ncbi:MAG TPA: PaaI family thioesterase [Amycolatopsis sp.]|nr:PaaI family thioesterase [Amycolatopsis sp.]